MLVAVDGTQKFHNLKLMGYVEIRRGLVKQQYGRLLCQSACNHHTLQLSAAHLAWKREPQMPRICLFHSIFNNIPILLRLVLQMVLIGVAPHQDSLKSRKLNVCLRMLLHQRHLLSPLPRRILAYSGIIYAHRAAVRRQQTADTPQQSRLATTVGTKDGGESTLCDVESQIAQYCLCAV